jgi:hypothetical protein
MDKIVIDCGTIKKSDLLDECAKVDRLRSLELAGLAALVTEWRIFNG